MGGREDARKGVVIGQLGARTKKKMEEGGTLRNKKDGPSKKTVGRKREKGPGKSK